MPRTESRPLTQPRGSPRARLISSLVMLLLVAAAMAWYSVRKTNQLFDTGINDQVECAIAGAYPQQTQTAEREKGLGSQFGPMLK
ncbi:MAG TPA: hypothetical protein VHC72_18860, partial [Bryobacteraceae bacterium]|nr:hypothetical protein [Bryobacteraceae bacterium]